ncbi:MAG: hypothetical protein QOH83_373 [Solirubrobacteraceae bacterium]|jgi:hypothetical protein|nr:hypothetical protein [Solirubrobacteraceae bacterium]
MSCFLYLATDDRMRERADTVGRITDAIPASVQLPRRQVAMISWDDGTSIEALALLTRGRRVASYKTGIGLTDFVNTHPIAVDRLSDALGSPHDERLRAATIGGGWLPDDTAENLRPWFDGSGPGPWRDLEVLAEADPPPLWRTDRVPVVAYEREAVGLALSLAGLERQDVMRTWNGDPEAPFLTSLRAFRAMEDPTIANDAQIFGDWKLLRPSTIGATRFEQRGRKLTVLNVNRLAVERNVGCDLVYYVHTYKAYVLVQYKRMERAGNDWHYRPETKLDGELARMRAIAAPVTQGDDPLEHRLGDNFCFLKLCKGEVENPFSGELAQGMYIPLDLWDKLESAGTLTGPRGGRLASFGNVDRYLTNTDFVALVQKSWLGTRGVTSDAITKVIERSLDAGNSLILAVGDSHETRAYRRPGR